MNVSASPTPAAGPVATIRDGGAGATDAAAAGGLDAFIALLAQANPPVAAVTGELVPAPRPDPDTEAEFEELPDAVDWALPFLTPPGTSPETPLDLELPDPAGAVVPTTPPPTGTTAREPQTLAVLLDAAVAGIDANAAETEPTQALTAAAPTHATRTEAPVASPPVTRTVHVPVSDSRWPAQVGHEVRLLVERGVQAATLRVNPEHLGPVEVRIDIVNDKANVVFGAAQAETRAALVDALPKLREMFAESGLALGDTGVRQDTPGGFAEPSTARRNPQGDFGADEADPTAAVQGIAAQVGLIDAYA